THYARGDLLCFLLCLYTLGCTLTSRGAIGTCPLVGITCSLTTAPARRDLAACPRPDAACVSSCPSCPHPLGGRIKDVAGMPRALRWACWTEDNGCASCR